MPKACLWHDDARRLRRYFAPELRVPTSLRARTSRPFSCGCARGTSFVHETESQVILNGSRDISFTMDLVATDIGLFQQVADSAGVELDLNPLLIGLFEDAIARLGPRELSPNIIKRLEERTGLDIRAPGFPAILTDDEPEEPGYEVRPKR